MMTPPLCRQTVAPLDDVTRTSSTRSVRTPTDLAPDSHSLVVCVRNGVIVGTWVVCVQCTHQYAPSVQPSQLRESFFVSFCWLVRWLVGWLVLWIV